MKSMGIKLYDTLSKSIKTLPEPDRENTSEVISFYCCGPTVYDYTHIGHLRTYVNNDLLKRTLQYAGYKVKHVMNITDVGHLTGDDDSGEDKLEKGALKKGKTVWDIAEFYTDYFVRATAKMNIIPPNILARATDHIPEMIALIQKLETKKHTYETDEAVYFDISSYQTYGKFSRQKLDEKKVQVREEVYADPLKKHPADFALWFKRVGRFKNHTMYWSSPWGEGFPGWHIECSAMSMKYLGDTIDIHAGGIDHVSIHHENEVAQSEAASGKTFVHCWFHNNFLLVEGEKMSKSKNNFLTLEDLEKSGITAAELRYHFLQAHYRQIMNYTAESIAASRQSFNRLNQTVLSLKKTSRRENLSPEKLTKIQEYSDQFRAAVINDLQIPEALAVLWRLVKSNIPAVDKLDLILDFDRVLGLGLSDVREDIIPDEVKKLSADRDKSRLKNDFAAADELRHKIELLGYVAEDTPKGTVISKK